MSKKKVKMLSQEDDFLDLSIVCKLMQTKIYVMKYFNFLKIFYLLH